MPAGGAAAGVGEDVVIRAAEMPKVSGTAVPELSPRGDLTPPAPLSEYGEGGGFRG